MLQCTKMQDAIAKKAIALCRRNAFALLVATSFLLGGCGSIPDVVNPFTWFEDDEPVAQPAAGAPKPGSSTANKAYPKLGTVPKRPPSLESQQSKIAQGLAADIENARYTDQKIQREVARRAAAPRSAPSTNAVPAPRPVPPAPRVSAARAQPVAPRPAPAPAQRSVLPPPQSPRASEPARAVPQPPAPKPAMVTPRAQTARQPVAPPALTPPPSRPPGPALSAGETIKVATIYFMDGATKLQGNDQAILREIAAAQRQTGSTIRVIGHASGRVNTFDASRRYMINYQVSLNRAHAVAAALREMGVPVGKLQVEGKGDTAPLYAEYSPTGEAANRRAELYFVN